MGKSVGFRETKDGAYDEFLDLFPRSKNINEWFTGHILNYIEKNKAKKESLDPFTDPNFVATPEFMANKERIIKFCQNQDDDMLKEISRQAWIWRVISTAYLSCEKKDRPNKFFASLLDMEKRGSGF